MVSTMDSYMIFRVLQEGPLVPDADAADAADAAGASKVSP